MSQLTSIIFEFQYLTLTWDIDAEGLGGREYYRILWEHTDKDFKVLKATQSGVNFGNFSEITTGSDLVEHLQVSKVDFKLEIVEGDYIRTFERTNKFPYASSTLVLKPSDDVVDDLEGHFTITPSSEGSADGEIYPDATGTNTPFYARIGSTNFQPLSLIQASISEYSTWSGLFTGTYQVQIKDAENFVRTYSLFVPVIKDTNSYASKYHIEYGSYRLEIHKRGFAGASNQLSEIGSSAVTLDFSGNSALYDSQIISSSAHFQLIENTLGEFSEFETAAEEDYKVIFYEQGSPDVLLWQGFITTELIEGEIYNTPLTLNIMATDRMADLKEEEINLNKFSGNPSMMDLIHECLSTTNLDQGYRIANTLYEESQTVNDQTTPFHHTYLEKEALKGRSCERVLSDILKIFNADVRSWRGYFYIIRRDDAFGGSVEFKEFDKSLTYVQKFTYTNRLEFKDESQSTFWRWGGRMQKIKEPQYRRVDLKFNLSDNKNFLPEINDNNYSIKYGDGIGGFVVNTGIIENDAASFKVGRYNSYQYLFRTGEIEHLATDSFKLSYDLLTSYGHLNSSEYNGAYYPVKMQFKIGSYYFDQYGDWTTTETTNTYFLKSLGDNKVEFGGPLFGVSDGTTSSYELKIWAASVCESNIQGDNESDMIAQMREIETIPLSLGARIIARDSQEGLFSDTIYLFYYELLQTSDAEDGINLIEPTDYNVNTNRKKWKLVQTASFFGELVSTYGFRGTNSKISNLKIDILPGHEEYQDEFIEGKESPGTKSNRRTLETSVYHYDPLRFSNFRYVFKNTINMANSTKPQDWGDDGLRIQDYYHRELLRLFKNSRYRVNGDIYSDILLEPIHILFNSTLNNVELLPLNMTIKTKAGEKHSADLVEYLSDDISTLHDFNQADFLPADFI